MTESKTTTKVAKKATPKANKKEVKTDGPFAVIKTGGKQYLINEGSTIRIEKILGLKEGDKVQFDEVLLKGEGDTATIGTPLVDKASVSGVVSKVGRSAKVVVMKYKQKSRYHKKNGHRQPFFDVLIESIK